MKAQSSEVVSHLSLRNLFWGDPQEVSQRLAEILVGKSSGLEDELHKDAQKRLDTRIVEAKRRDPLSLDSQRLNDSVQLSLANCTVVADSLNVKETSIGLEAYLPQSGQVVQSFADIEVPSLVDRRLGPQGASFLVVLLDPSVFIVDMQRGDDSLSNHSGLEASRSLATNLLVKD